MGIFSTGNFSTTPGGGSTGPAVDKTLSTTGALAIDGPGKYTVNAFSGVTDTLASISGGNVGDIIYLSPATGDTITVDGADLNMDGAFIMDDVMDVWVARQRSAGVWEEVGRNAYLRQHGGVYHGRHNW
ncbi:MAG: hypothetical protein ACYSX1_13620 [Planctomycetota bacterium]|jgi:hypothetical protein